MWLNYSTQLKNEVTIRSQTDTFLTSGTCEQIWVGKLSYCVFF